MEKIKKRCKNFWCKAFYLSSLDDDNKTCPKCRSFNDDLSGGIDIQENIEYSGPRFDGKSHQTDIKINKGR